MKKELLRIENGKKDTLLNRVCLQVYEGEITNLVFDNIQEKQLFLEIMSGYQEFDYAKVSYLEEAVDEKQIANILAQNTAVVSRETNLIDAVSIEENIFLIRQGVEEMWVRRHRFRKDTKRLLQKFHVEIDLHKSVSQLTAFERVELEILKAYYLGKRIIFLTALTNFLNDTEIKKLWELLKQMKELGISFVVTEPLEDIEFDYMDAVVIIKKGKTCAVKDAKNCDYTMLHTILYRDEMQKTVDKWGSFQKEEQEQGEVNIGEFLLENFGYLSFSIRKGEIVKLFCVDESSYDEVVGKLKGKHCQVSKGLQQKEAEIDLKSILRGFRNGLGIVEGNPAMSSLFGEMSAMDNLCIPLSHKAKGIWTALKYRRSIRLLLDNILDDEVYDRRVKDLEPSDVQRIIYCKWLLYAPDLLICIQPFAEGDIKARETAREMIYLLQERKIPIVIITSNTAELNYCRGRDLYLKNGKLISKEMAYRILNSDA